MEGHSSQAVLRGAAAGPGAIEVANKRFHFIGAGGVGMSGLAKLLLKNGAIVSGSDQTASGVIENLCKLGAQVNIGHNAGNLGPQTEAVVISAAIDEDNPELKAAREKECKIYKYAEMLGQLSNCYEPIAVAGTHGKSTTSGWLVYCLKEAGADPNFIVGAEITQLGSSSGVGNGRYFVAEACEYDRSFLNIKPKIACILNIEQDHLDYYKDEGEIIDAFAEFARGVREGGVLIANGQDPNVAKIIMDSRLRWNDKGNNPVHCETFGIEKRCNWRAQDIRLVDGFYAFELYHNDEVLGSTRISLPGRHNVLNAVAVAAMATNTGFAPERVLELLGEFTGMDRRLMLKGRVGEITVLDDYAHHPTEIRASLAAMRQRYEPERIWCIFQPHQYSRTRFLLDDFAESFKLADVTIVPEIYFVRDSELAKKEVNARVLVERIRDNGSEAVFIDGFGAICDYLKSKVGPGELVVTMGAGDIWKVADGYIQWLRANS
jgi:UDP-N-acetylmuramate--alanine ligase